MLQQIVSVPAFAAVLMAEHSLFLVCAIVVKSCKK
jgi:hypothetical protein